MEKNNKIYVAFLTTPTKMGRIIRKVTKYKYNHVAISLESDLQKMYSFARYNYSVPLVGGFVTESSLRYKYGNVTIKVCEISLTHEEYKKIKEYLSYVIKNKEEYVYNSFSALLTPFGKKTNIKNSYTCLEFVCKVLEKINIIEDVSFNQINSIQKLDEALFKYTVFEGDMKEIAFFDTWGEDKYSNPVSFFKGTGKTIKHFYRLILKKLKN